MGSWVFGGVAGPLDNQHIFSTFGLLRCFFREFFSEGFRGGFTAHLEKCLLYACMLCGTLNQWSKNETSRAIRDDNTINDSSNIKERPPGLIQHVLTVRVFLVRVLLMSGFRDSCRSLRVRPWTSSCCMAPPSKFLDLLPSVPLPLCHSSKSGTHNTIFFCNTRGHAPKKKHKFCIILLSLGHAGKKKPILPPPKEDLSEYVSVKPPMATDCPRRRAPHLKFSRRLRRVREFLLLLSVNHCTDHFGPFI